MTQKFYSGIDLNLARAIHVADGLGDDDAVNRRQLDSAIRNHEGLPDPHPAYATQAEVDASIAAHEAEADPHPQYLTMGESGSMGVTRLIVPISANTVAAAATKTDYIYVCSGSTAFSLTMPAPAGNTNFYMVKRIGTANITINTAGGVLIDGVLTFVLTVQYQSIGLFSDGTAWLVV